MCIYALNFEIYIYMYVYILLSASTSSTRQNFCFYTNSLLIDSIGRFNKLTIFFCMKDEKSKKKKCQK
jgi:hypothetical protein